MYFWKANLKPLNCRVVTDSPNRMFNYVVYSDASATRCGAHLDINGEHVCNKQWNLVERRKSSTGREFSDSQSACRIIQVGSMRSILNAIALSAPIMVIGRFQPIVFMFLEARGFFQWIVLLVIIIRFASFSLDFGTQVVAGWIFFVQNLEAEISLVVPPVSLIARAVHFLPVSRAFATIVVPFLAVVIFLAHYF